MNNPRTPSRMEKIRLVLERRQKDLTLILDNIHDPHNVSAIYRSCDAFGVPCVHLYYTGNSFPLLSAKSSASARKWVESRRYADAGALLKDLRSGGMRVYAAVCTADSRPVHACDFTGPSAFILGNEHGGVAEELFSLADDAIHIPMYGMIQSFNVSVAAALILYEASRQRAAAGLYDRPSCSGEELAALSALWAQK
ncbi:MAG: RNA methyltransferase [Deltaproteobacteria bacterium]|jgi:tRNA (guanosine-2'-O-)-methyltransferase|nr:RNA methyltransferase [Deltaproteobacteria bacterium]